jgi:hypothetical protein
VAVKRSLYLADYKKVKSILAGDGIALWMDVMVDGKENDSQPLTMLFSFWAFGDVLV